MEQSQINNETFTVLAKTKNPSNQYVFLGIVIFIYFIQVIKSNDKTKILIASNPITLKSKVGKVVGFSLL